MAPTARVLLGLGWTWVVGAVAIGRFVRDLRPGERAGWSLAAGLLLQSLLALVLTALGLPLRPPGMIAGGVLIGAALAMPERKGAFAVTASARPSKTPGAPGAESPRPSRRMPDLLMAGALVAWLVFLVASTAEPMWSTDYLAIWGLKGKVVFETSAVPQRLFRDPALYWSHREYPLLVPLSLAALAAIAGEWNDRALALLFPAAELATLLALSGILARKGSRMAGSAAALLAALCFRLYHPVNAGTAEAVFALGAVLAACAFLDLAASEAGDAGGGVRARLAVAALFCAAAKQEGTLWIALLGVLYLLREPLAIRTRRGRVTLAAFLLPAALHWVLLFLLRGPETRRDFDFHFFEPSQWADLARRFAGVVLRIATTEVVQASVALSAIALFLLVTRRGFADRLLLAIGAQIFFYCVAFSVSSFDPMYAVDGAFRRIALTLFPTLTLVLCARLTPIADDAAG